VTLSRCLLAAALATLAACGGEEGIPWGMDGGFGGAGTIGSGGRPAGAGGRALGTGGSTGTGGTGGASAGSGGSAVASGGGAAAAGAAGGAATPPGPGCGTCTGKGATCSNGWCTGAASPDCQLHESWVPERSTLCSGRKDGWRCAICAAPERPADITVDCVGAYADADVTVLCVLGCEECS